MDRSFRKRILFAAFAVVLVLVLVAGTAIVALRATETHVSEAGAIDARLVLVDRLRTESRELAMSARRSLLSGETADQQRVFAIIQDMRVARAKLGARTAFANGPVLEADLDEYIASLTHAMSFHDENAVVRLSRFEDELARIRKPLTADFDGIVSRERTRRQELHSALTLGRSARWAVLIATVLAIGLVISTARTVARKLAPAARDAPSDAASSIPPGDPPSEPSLLR